MLKNYTLILLMFLGLSISAQDFHHTYFEHVPLYVNPGLAGGFEGTVRASGIYRDQYGSVAASPFRTFDLGVEYNLPYRPRGKDWIAAGLSFAQDKVGRSGLSRSAFRLGAAYHLGLGKKVDSDLALGIQIVSNSRGIDRLGMNATSGGILNGGAGDEDIMRFNNMGSGSMNGENNPMASYSDYIAGLVYTKRGKSGVTRFGVSGAHVLKANQAFVGRSELDPRITAFFQMDRMMNKTYSIEPALLAQFQGGATDISAHALVGMNMKKDYMLRFKAGLGYRVGDAIQLLLGTDYKDWKFGFAYDANISGLSVASNTIGGFELSAIRQINIKKKPDVKPVIFCPRI